MKDVFISHVEEDASLVLKLASALEEQGFTTWFYERDGEPGPSYLVQTARAIEQSHAFLLVISKESLGSHQITKEVVRAHEAGKPFIPLRVDVSHVEFQARQPEWKEAVGAATSIGLASRDLEDVFAAIRRGLHSLGVEPRGQARQGVAPMDTKASPPQSTVPDTTPATPVDAGTLFDENTRRGPLDRTTPLKKQHRLLLAVAAVVIFAISGWFGWRYWNAHVSIEPSDFSRTPKSQSAQDGDYKSAEDLYKRALANNEQYWGKEHFETAKSLTYLGNLYLSKGEYKLAEPLLKRALAICEKQPRPNNKDIAAANNNLAELYCAEGDYKSADPYYKRVLTITNTIIDQGEEDQDIANLISNIGIYYQSIRDFESAEACLKRSLSIFEKIKGKEHSDTVRALNRLAKLYQDKEDYKAAKP